MAAGQNVSWRLTRPFESLVTAVRTRLNGETASLSNDDERHDECDEDADEPSTDSGTGHLLSPRERVLQLLGDNGGRMKQSAIVSAVDWSESTVSRKLQRLEADGTVVRYRIGREKLVFLPGTEPDSFGSALHSNDETQRLAA